MKKLSTTATVASILMLTTSTAFAAGFAVREQSAQYQGSSFAGNAAGSGLSVMFWNSAGAANSAGPGIFLESHYSLILPRSEVTVTSVSDSEIPVAAFASAGPFAGAVAAGVNANVDAAFNGAGTESGNIGRTAMVGATYGSMQIAENVFMGFALNSPFGLVTEPDNTTYAASVLARTTSLLTFNANPTVAFRVSPGVTVGVGAQLQFGDGRLKFATGLPDRSSTSFEGDGWAFGATAGIMLEPAAGTRIGVGYRSRLKQKLSGIFQTPGLSVATGLPGPAATLSGASTVQADADIELPDIVTVSLEQALTPSIRVSATFEWANWSRLEKLEVYNGQTNGIIQTIETNWDDSYYYAVGADVDVSSTLTVRAGVAYEISPTSSPEKRLTSIPDADRLWVSGGGTYKWSEATSFDFAYTHIFVDDARFNRNASVGVNIQGEVESSVDIISASMKTRW